MLRLIGGIVGGLVIWTAAVTIFIGAAALLVYEVKAAAAPAGGNAAVNAADNANKSGKACKVAKAGFEATSQTAQMRKRLVRSGLKL